MANIYISIKVHIYILTNLLTKYWHRHRYRDISSISYCYNIEI